jgi:hypothetical protein
MEKIKTYNQFLNESRKNNIVNVILDVLEPTIVEMISTHEKWFVETFNQEFTEYDREMARLDLIYDMVKSIETYTLPTDSLITLNVSKSAKGNIEISSQIQRDKEVYNFKTEVIYAGGHNIQRLHYRYIVKTNIPKTGANQLTKEYSDKIKKMSKAEKLNNDIKDYEARILKTQQEIKANLKLSDADIIQVLKDKKDWYEWPTWSVIVQRDAAKNYNDDESYYNQQMQDSIANKIESWKKINIISKEKSIIDYNKTLKKLKAKLDSML